MYICIKKGKSTWFLALKIWALAVLKFFDVVLKFELPNTQVLNFPKNSALSLIRLVLINGDCVYMNVSIYLGILNSDSCKANRKRNFRRRQINSLYNTNVCTWVCSTYLLGRLTLKDFLPESNLPNKSTSRKNVKTQNSKPTLLRKWRSENLTRRKVKIKSK